MQLSYILATFKTCEITTHFVSGINWGQIVCSEAKCCKGNGVRVTTCVSPEVDRQQLRMHSNFAEIGVVYCRLEVLNSVHVLVLLQM